MMKRCVFVLLAGCCLLLAPAGPVSAAGGGLQFGPTLLFPSLNVTETYDDNILLVYTDDGREAESDWVTSVNPALRLLLPSRNFFLIAEGGVDFVTYREHEEENSENWFFGVTGGGEFPGGLSFKVSDMYHDRYLVGSQEFGPGEDTTLNTLQAKVAYARRNVLRLEVSATRTTYTFETSTGLERGESTVTAGLYWKFRPNLSSLLEATFSGYGYDSNTAQDGGATQAALGLTWDVTARSTGLFKVGYQWKRYEDENDALGTVNAAYYTVSAGLKHAFSRRTNVQADLTRASQEADVSDFSGNPYYLKTSLGASLSQRFTTKIYGRAGVRYLLDEYPNEGSYADRTGKRTDKTLNGQLAVGFDVTRWLTLEAAYGVERRTSTLDLFEYTATRVSLSAKAAF